MAKKYYVIIMKETMTKTRKGEIKVSYKLVKEKSGFDTYEKAEEWARKNAKEKTYNIGVYFEL